VMGFIEGTTKPRQEGGVCRKHQAASAPWITNSRDTPGSGDTATHAPASAQNIPDAKNRSGETALV
jgi:hypothetical protein